MHKLSFTLILFLIAFYVQAQSPHGESFKIDCAQCHTSNSWSVDVSKMQFNHDNTNFKLIGQHKNVSCKDCHKSLDFKDKRQSCTECHTDMHNNTLGKDCARCHTPNSWIIKNTSEIHQQSRFPLLGAHRTALCTSCHKSSSNLQFEPIGIDCYNCHQKDFHSTTSPNHTLDGYSTNCIECHNVNSSSWNTKVVDHSFFPLTAGHAIGCTKCHVTGSFGKLPTDCNSCHQKNYTAAQVPNHTAAGITSNCEMCHTNTAWKPSSFKHITTGYELKGAHTELVQCSDCHKGNLTSAKQECISCHQVQYDNAVNHKKAGYSTDCITCHTPTNWLQSSFNHATTNYQLTGAHKTVECALCHTSQLKGTPTICGSCHQKDYTASLVPSHRAAGMPNTCETCHNTTAWKPSSFNHTTTGFELTGGHKNVMQCSDCHLGTLTAAKPECISCHQVQYNNAPNHKQLGYSTNCVTCHRVGSATWSSATIDHSFFPLTAGHNIGCIQCHVSGTNGKLPTDCNSCHQKNYIAAQIPNHTGAGIPTTCETCHTPTKWKPSSFNHTTTGFELKGTHNTLVQCSDCHKGNLTSAKTECISCHQGQYDTAPNHKQASYSTDCVICHGPGSVNWTSATIDHSFFPLTAGHNIGCIQCHVSGTNGKLPTDCNSCHQKNYVAAQVPNHTVAGIPTTCENCHTPTTWKPSSFNHTTTGFELKGTHNTIVQCSDCHKGNLTSAKTECISCHQVQYNNAPNHKNAGYSTDCTTCHTPTNWLQSSFNHSTTNYPLTGVHKTVECALCHTSQLKGTPTICSSCHQKDYIAALVPSHSIAGIPNTCETCHTTTAWKPSSFNHTTTGFELKGVHNTLIQCSDCHKGNLTSAKTECISCHQMQYDTAPNHKQSGYPTDCAMCHTPINWLQSSFNHATTIFPLTGAHTSVNCVLCHTNGFGGGTPTVCNSCHQKDYTAALVPSHSAAGIPNTCETCHTTTAWKPSSFSHITTGYELKGTHSTLTQCSDCHKGNLTAAKPECISCHQVQYDGAAGHKQLGYPTDCTICHTTVNWLQSSFNHSTTSFPLTGAHTTVACSSCHTIGFKGTPTACFSCHATTYNNTTNPNHKAANFPTTCQTCHSTTNWTTSTFNHTSYFPINTSRHNVSCATCHTNSANYIVYTCITTACHAKAHNRSQGSTGCYNCHPTGKAD